MVVRFVVLAAARTGSNYFNRLLNRTADVWAHGEIFNETGAYIKTPPEDRQVALREQLLKLRKTDQKAFLERVLQLNYGKACVGFKVFPGHGGPNLYHELATDPSLKKIVLFRANALAVYSSRLAARQSGAWNKAQMQLTERPKVQFIEADFDELRKRYLSSYRYVMAAMATARQPFHLIRYDELNERCFIDGVVTFLGGSVLSKKAADSEIRGSSDLLTRFDNPAEVEKHLRKHGLLAWTHEADVTLQAQSSEKRTPARSQ